MKKVVLPIVGFLALIGGLLLGDAYLLQRTEQYYLRQTTEQLKLSSTLLTQSLEKASSFSRMLYQTPTIEGLVRSHVTGVDPMDGTSFAEWQNRLGIIGRGMLNTQADIYQIRFIGVSDEGRELVRVNKTGNEVAIVPEADLQRKFNRDYFQAGLDLNPGELLFSNFDLNKEYGQIEFPHRPTFRTVQAVFDDQRKVFGLVVLNHSLAGLFDELHAVKVNPDLEIYLLNQYGNFLLSPSEQMDFKFEYGDEETFVNAYEQQRDETSAFNKVKARRSGLVDLLYLEQKVYLGSPNGGRYVSVVVALPQDRFISALNQRRIDIGAVILIVLLIALSIGFFAYRYLINSSRLNRVMSLHESVIKSSKDAIIAVDSNGKISVWNAAATQLTGVRADKVLNEQANHFLPEFLTQAGDDLANGVSTVSELEGLLVTTDGHEIVVVASVSLVTVHAQDSDRGYTLILRDVTAERRLASELEEQNRALEIATIQAQDADRLKSEFVSNMSHEMRTPLNGIVGVIHGLGRSKNLSPSEERLLEMGMNSVNTLNRLIGDILDLARIEASRLEFQRQEFSLMDATAALIATLRLPAEDAGLEVILDTTDITQDYVVGDSIRYKQIVSNLFTNAVKFTQQGFVEVRLGSQRQASGLVHVRLVVQDSGIGVDTTETEKLFQPFVQGDGSSTREFGGTGLGLSITQRLCELMQGSAEIDTHYKGGARFIINLTLPAGNHQPETSLPLVEGQEVAILIRSERKQNIMATHLTRFLAIPRVLGGVNELKDYLAAAKLSSMLVVEEALILVDEELQHSLEQMVKENRIKVIFVEKVNSSQALVETGPYVSSLLPTNEISTAIVRLFGFSPDLEPVKSGGKLEDQYDAQLRALRPVHILVVDDLRTNFDVVCSHLEYLGVKVTWAMNGEECLNFLHQAAEPVDLILMDCMMPVMNGFEATRKIRSGLVGLDMSSVPIVAMTAAVQQTDRQNCFSAGMNDFIGKPLEPLVFKKLILEQLEKVRNRSVEDEAEKITAIRNNSFPVRSVTELVVEELEANFKALTIAVAQSRVEQVTKMARCLADQIDGVGLIPLEDLLAEMENWRGSADGKSLDELYDEARVYYRSLLEQIKENQERKASLRN